jgi:hypothetical protein
MPDVRPDGAEIRRSVSIICNGLTELRIPSIHLAGYYTDYDALVRDAIQQNSRAEGVFIVPNGIDTDLLARSVNRLRQLSELTKDPDVTVRRWVLIDLDPPRKKGISSTDEEHEAALATARQVIEWFVGFGIPREAIILADSGNGAHVLVRLPDLPNDDKSRDMATRILQVIKAEFEDGTVLVDQTTFNASRIWKLYGTVARKGDSTPERPHRLSRILVAPGVVVTAPLEILEGIASLAPRTIAAPTQPVTSTFDLEAWMKKYGISVTRNDPWNGGTRYILRECPFDAEHNGSSVAILQFPSGAISFKCQHNGCAGKKWEDVRRLKEWGFIATGDANNVSTYINDNNIGSKALPESAHKIVEAVGGHLSGHLVDKLGTSPREYGELADAFDTFLRENREAHYKRDVAEATGVYKGDAAFIKLVQRRADPKQKGGPKIRILNGGDKIQWINRDWRNNVVSLEAVHKPLHDLRLPFGLEEHVLIPSHCQIIVAGDVGSGKTHYAYALADLNVGRIPIMHFFNEIGEAKAVMNLEDYPALRKHLCRDYYLIDLDKDPIEVADNIDPEGLNIYDYLHLPCGNQWFLQVQSELAMLSRKLTTGVVVVFMQKLEGAKYAMSGESTKMQSDLYLSLNKTRELSSHTEGRIDVMKCRNWHGEVNPIALSFRYKTGPRWGKLVNLDSEWTAVDRG